jgi:hypothetical protein
MKMQFIKIVLMEEDPPPQGYVLRDTSVQFSAEVSVQREVSRIVAYCTQHKIV